MNIDNIETQYAQFTDSNKPTYQELMDFVKTVAGGDSASHEAKVFMVHSYIYRAKQLLEKNDE